MPRLKKGIQVKITNVAYQKQNNKLKQKNKMANTNKEKNILLPYSKTTIKYL